MVVVLRVAKGKLWEKSLGDQGGATGLLTEPLPLNYDGMGCWWWGFLLRGVAGGPWTNSYLLPLQLYTELLLQTADYSGVRSLLGVTAASVRPSKLYTT